MLGKVGAITLLAGFVVTVLLFALVNTGVDIPSRESDHEGPSSEHEYATSATGINTKAQDGDGNASRQEAIRIVLQAEADNKPVEGALLTSPDIASFRAVTAIDGSATLPKSGLWHYQHVAFGEGKIGVSVSNEQPFSLPLIGKVNLHVEFAAGPAHQVSVRPIRMPDALADKRVRPSECCLSQIDAAGNCALDLSYGVWKLLADDGRVALEPSIVCTSAPVVSLNLSTAPPRFDGIAGMIVDERGRPVSGMRLSLAGTINIIAESGRGGRFTIDRKKAGPARYPTVDIAGDGYESVAGYGPLQWGSDDNVVRVRTQGGRWLKVARYQDGRDAIQHDWAAWLHPGNNVGGRLSAVPLSPEASGLGLLPQSCRACDWILVTSGAGVALYKVGDLSESNGVLTARWVAQSGELQVTDPEHLPVQGATVHVMLATCGESAVANAAIVSADWRPGIAAMAQSALELEKCGTNNFGVATYHWSGGEAPFLRVEPPSGYLPVVLRAKVGRQLAVVDRAGSLRGRVSDLEGGASVVFSLLLDRLDNGAAGMQLRRELKAPEYAVDGIAFGRYRMSVEKRSGAGANSWAMGDVEVRGTTTRNISLGLLHTVHATIVTKGLEHRPEVSLGLLRVIGSSRSLCFQNVSMRSSERIGFELAPGTYEVVAKYMSRLGMRYTVKALGQLICDKSDITDWNAVFDDSPGALRVLDLDSQPIMPQWFMIDPPSNYIVRTDSDGVIGFEVWPGVEFDIQCSRCEGGVWLPVGPVYAVRGSQRSICIAPLLR